MAKMQVNGKEKIQLDCFHRSEAAVPERMQPNPNSLAHIKHGVLANSILSIQERDLFYGLIARFEKDYELNESADFMQVELVTLYFLQLGRAIKVKDWENAERIDRTMRGHLREMKATKRGREGDTVPASTMQSPAEYATAILERVAAAQAAGRVVGEQRIAEMLPGGE